MGREIKLMAASGVNLAEHVGHQVEVRGRFSGAGGSSSSDPRPSPAGSPAAGQSGSIPDRPAGDRAGRALTVSSVRMVSASCTSGS
jgi:hypothetical protein